MNEPSRMTKWASLLYFCVGFFYLSPLSERKSGIAAEESIFNNNFINLTSSVKGSC